MLNKKCISCGSENNLNKISLIVNGKSYNIAVCDEHSALSLKQLQNAVTAKMAGVNDAIDLLKSAGYHVLTDQELAKYKTPSRVIEQQAEMPVSEEKAVVPTVPTTNVSRNKVQVGRGINADIPSDVVITKVPSSVIDKSSRMHNGDEGVKYSKECSACRGNGVNPVTKSACKKCGGTGFLI